ncbi:MAG: Lipopolysaccharide biosynthesis protein [uncultured bacterium]|nr:MAG: Lipopolysaccharide biosynthesis protein [uncultured bacterium]
MTLIKTSFWTGLSVLIKTVVTFAISKIVALYTGPVGLAITEQFQNLLQIVRTFSGSLIQQGVVKYVAEYNHDIAVKSRILSSAAFFCVLVSIVLGIFLLLFSAEIARLILQSIIYQKVIVLCAVSIILFSLNSFLLAILNGEREIIKLVSCNIANTLLSLVMTAYLVIYYGLYGGLIALVCNQSVVLFFTLSLVVRCKWFTLHSFVGGIDLDSLGKLTKYAFITIISTLAVPLSQIIVRNYVASTFSWEEAGYWQGMMKLSNNYFILIDATLGVYFLPRFAEICSVSELKKEIIRSYQYLLPFIIGITMVLFILKREVVMLLYSKQFIPMLFLFKYQLIGDVARIGAWLLSYVLIAKAMMKTLIVTELSLLLFYPIVTIILVHYFGLIGTSMGFALSYLFYWALMIFFVMRYTAYASSTDEHKAC